VRGDQLEIKRNPEVDCGNVMDQHETRMSFDYETLVAIDRDAIPLVESVS
jgi:hypothetical protein